MSNSKPPIHPTRQQLDELEALMQRMLALPVNQLDGTPAPEASLSTLAPIDLPPEWDSGEPAVLSAEAARQAWDTGRATARPPTSEPRPEMPGAAPSDSNGPNGADENPGVPPAKIIVARPTRGERPWALPASASRVPWPIRPLLWSNRAFDRCAGLLGGPGRWLRGPRGRAWIGWSGMVLLATAVAWAWLEWMGWTW